LDEGEEYDFRVMAVNEEGEGEPLVTSGPIKAKFPFDVPGKPGSPECTGTTEDSITLSWDPPMRDGGKPIKGYVLEKREAGSKRWVKASPHEIKDTEFTVKGLIEGRPYEFRVAAVNEAGVGGYAETSEALKASAPICAPKALLDALQSDITAVVGEPFKIRVPFKGSPTPLATWFNSGKELSEDGRIKFDIVGDEVILTCQAAKPDDAGRYSVNLKNPKGSDTAYINVNVVDKPGAPEGPLEVSKITPDSCKLAWNPPKTDGGKPISHYMVEKRDKKSGVWTPVSKFCRNPECDVGDLEEGEQYDFRVSAVNEQGQGEPLLTDKPITAKHQFNAPGKSGAPRIDDVDEDSVVLSWDKPSSDGGDKIKGYVVEMREKGSSKWTPLNDKKPCLDSKYTANDLEKGKEYEFRVRAKNRAGLGDPSQPSDTVVPKAKATKASPPGLPNIDKIGKDYVDLSWTKPRSDGGSPIKGYKIERRRPAGAWEKASDDPVTGESFRVPDLDEGDEYEFRVAAITDAGVGDFSLNTMPVKVYERKAAKLPEFIKRPEDVTVPTDEDAKFEVIVDGEPKPQVKWYMDGLELKSGGKYRIVDDGDKVQLIVKGVSKDDAGDITCELSNSKGKDTAVARLRVQTPPQVEKELREQQVEQGETLKLKIPFSGTGPFSFKLKKDNREVPSGDNRVKIIPFDDYVILQIKDADKDDTGKYKVEISNDSGMSSCEVPIKVKAVPGPCGPLNVSDVTKNACHLKWKAPEDDGGSRITHYVVERQETGKPYWTTVASFQKELDMDVQGLIESKEYLFRVAAANANGTGEFTDAPSKIIAKMPFDPPGPPGEPEGTEIGGDFVSLSWEKPRSDGGGRILGYYVEKKEASADNWSRVNAVPTPATIFNVPNLIEDREYDFRVFAVNEAGESTPAATSRRITIKDPKAPTPPEIIHPLKPVTVAQGKSARFEVTVRGKPQPEITWYKGMRELTDSDKYAMSKEGDTYVLVIHNAFGEDADEYSVKASTPSGHKTSRADLTIKSPPKAHVPPRFLDTANFEKTEDITIKIPFTGNPKPKAVWLRDGEELKNGDKYRIDIGDRHAILTIRKADRTDDGPYRLQLDNDLGTDSAIIKIAVNDVPDPPRFLNVDSIFHDSVMLTWKPPLNDGGGFITQYIVEKQEQGMTSWIRWGATRFTFATIDGLSPCHDYQFRVLAENLYGRSDPCEPTSLIKTVTEEEGRSRKGLDDGYDDAGRRKRSKFTGPKPDNYDRLYHNLWDKERPVPVDPIKFGRVHDYYDICEEIGTGAFGVVHRAIEKSTGRNFVAKFINTPYPADKNVVKAEIGLMNQLHHQKLLNLHDAFEDQHEMVLVLEYLSGGELFDQIADENYKMTEAEVIHYVKQICDGLCHMHEQNIVHLDVKPENIMCTTQKSRDVKLIDFGLAAKLDPEQIVKVSTATAEFASPEVADHEPVGFYTDMWAVGVLSYILLSGLSPFAGGDHDDTLDNVRKCAWKFDSESFRNISDVGKDFISKLLLKSPQKRMTVHEALDHPWLADDHSDLNSRIPSSRYSKIRKQIRDKYADWPTPMPAIGRIANYSSLQKHRPKEYQIYDSYFDRREAMPRFVRKPHACVVQEGNVANFKCKVLAGSPPIITWHFKTHTLNPSLKYMPKYAGTNYELRIGRCKMEDKGEYVVKAVNSFGSKEECAFLSVEPATDTPTRRAMSVEPTAAVRKRNFDRDFEGYQEPPDKTPHFEFHLRDRFIQEGIGFKLLASVNGKPTPKITWTKDRKELRVGGRYEIVYSLGICSLEIGSCEPSDAGIYTCVAENDQGTTETSSRVTVNERKVYKPSALLDSSFSSSTSSSAYSSSYRRSAGTGYRSTYRRTAYTSSSTHAY
jgi:serine/threonine protein kinase/predicted RNA-binding protein with TRAM domain